MSKPFRKPSRLATLSDLDRQLFSDALQSLGVQPLSKRDSSNQLSGNGAVNTVAVSTNKTKVTISNQQISREEQQIFREAIGEVQPLKSKYHSRRVEHKRAEILRVRTRQSSCDDQQGNGFLSPNIGNSDMHSNTWQDDLEGEFCQVGFDRRNLRLLRNGHWPIRASLDLHGMHREQALESVNEFLAISQQRQFRCVRLIHGVGYGSPGNNPVIKPLILRWLSGHHACLAYTRASPKDGGNGALLVLLRLHKNR